MTKNEILEMAIENGLSKIEITTGINGYPEGLGNYGVIGFDSYDDAAKFSDENGGEVVIFESKDGWHFWKNKGFAYRPFTSDDLLNDMGDNYSYADESNEFYAEQLSELASNFDGDFSNLENRIKEIKEIISAKENCSDDERVIVSYGNYYDTVKNNFMDYTYDTHKYAVGVFIKNDNE